MRCNWLICFLFLLGACDLSDPERFYPLTDEEKALLPSAYAPGDTLYFLYSDSVTSDTLPFVMEEPSSYFSEPYSIDGVIDYNEIAEVGFSCTKDKQRLVLSVGTFEEDDYYMQYFYVRFKGFYQSYLPDMTKESRVDTTLYELRRYGRYSGYNYDSIVMSYSPYTGVHRLQDFKSGYKLQKLP